MFLMHLSIVIVYGIAFLIFFSLLQKTDAYHANKFDDNQASCTLHKIKDFSTYLNADLGDGNTLMHFAAAQGYGQVIALLCGLGGDITRANYQGDTPLHEAARNGHHATVALLRKHMPFMHLKNSAGLTAAQLALRHGYDEVARLLA